MRRLLNAYFAIYSQANGHHCAKIARGSSCLCRLKVRLRYDGRLNPLSQPSQAAALTIGPLARADVGGYGTVGLVGGGAYGRNAFNGSCNSVARQLWLRRPRNYGVEMGLLGLSILLAVGVGSLWAALTHKTFYYPKLGMSKPGQPMPARLGRLVATLIGIFSLFLLFWGLTHER